MIIADAGNLINTESSSKGNQLKFHIGNSWVKIDSQFGSEGLAEEFVSQFENCISNFPYVDYKSTLVEYNGVVCSGCISENMLNDTTIFVSVRHILQGQNLRLMEFRRYDNVVDNIRNIVDIVCNCTGVDLTGYFGRLLLLDALILNEDRHWMNIGVCYDRGKYFEAPCFDNGSSLFCINWTYRARKSLLENIRFAESVARPFSKFYDKQVEAVLALGCKPLVINKSKLDYLLASYGNELYDNSKIRLVKDVLLARLHKYEGVAFNYV